MQANDPKMIETHKSARKRSPSCRLLYTFQRWRRDDAQLRMDSVVDSIVVTQIRSPALHQSLDLSVSIH